LENLNERDQLGDLDEARRIILKLITIRKEVRE
jgi:hypothetical protein